MARLAATRPHRLPQLPDHLRVGINSLERAQLLDQVGRVPHLVAPRDGVAPEHRGRAADAHRVLDDAVDAPFAAGRITVEHGRGPERAAALRYYRGHHRLVAPEQLVVA